MKQCPSAKAKQSPTPSSTPTTYTITRHNRNWKVLDPAGDLVCMTVYRCGAEEVIRRLSVLPPPPPLTD